MLFARLKRILNLTRLRLRGMNGARDEFLLAAIAQNLRRLAKLASTATWSGVRGNLRGNSTKCLNLKPSSTANSPSRMQPVPSIRAKPPDDHRVFQRNRRRAQWVGATPSAITWT
jgi:hypothetical protein